MMQIRLQLPVLFFFMAIVQMAVSQSVELKSAGYTNPVLRGFNPDPSICRVGEDY